MSWLRRHRALRHALAVLLVLATWLGRTASGVDAVRYRHEYCDEHAAIEHRADATDHDGDAGNHDACSLPSVIGTTPPPLPTPAVAPAVIAEVPPPLPATGAGGARAPPLSFAPKTSPPRHSALSPLG